MQAQAECREVNRLNFAIEIPVSFGAWQLEIHTGLRTCQLAVLNPSLYPFKALVERGMTAALTKETPPRRDGMSSGMRSVAFLRASGMYRCHDPQSTGRHSQPLKKGFHFKRTVVNPFMVMMSQQRRAELPW